MFITPLIPMTPIISGNKEATASSGSAGGGFKQLFTELYDQYKNEENKYAEDSYSLSVGGTDSLHNVEIDMKKAEMSLSLFLQVRTKAMDAYNELIRMSV